MQTIYTLRVEISAPPLSLQRTLNFATERERDEFIVVARGLGVSVKGLGIDHVITADEAIKECKREQASVL